MEIARKSYNQDNHLLQLGYAKCRPYPAYSLLSSRYVVSCLRQKGFLQAICRIEYRLFGQEDKTSLHRHSWCLQGRIKPYTFDGMAVGPKRVWLPYTDSPGLSMTRAFGDQLGASVGVSSEPEIRQVSKLLWPMSSLSLPADLNNDWKEQDASNAIACHQI